MALTRVAHAAGQPVRSLTIRWRELFRSGGSRFATPAAGDLLIVSFRDPVPGLAGPPGWCQATDRVFWRIAGANEPDPTFTGPDDGSEWQADVYEGYVPPTGDGFA